MSLCAFESSRVNRLKDRDHHHHLPVKVIPSFGRFATFFRSPKQIFFWIHDFGNQAKIQNSKGFSPPLTKSKRYSTHKGSNCSYQNRPIR